MRRRAVISRAVNGRVKNLYWVQQWGELEEKTVMDEGR